MSPLNVNCLFSLCSVSLALFILFLYMVMGAAIFTYTDKWDFWDSLYFVFISISTIGFGDLTPNSEWSMIVLSIYLLFGLALTSMCINVIQEQLAVAFEQTRVRLGTRMGFDIDQLNLSQIESTGDAAAGGGGGKESTATAAKNAPTKSDRSGSSGGKDDSSKRKASSGTNRKKSVSLTTNDTSGDKNNNNSGASEKNKNGKVSTGGKNSTVRDIVSTQGTSGGGVASSSSAFALTNDSLGKNLKERREQLKRKGDPAQVYNAKSIAFQEKDANIVSNASEVLSEPSFTASGGAVTSPRNVQGDNMNVTQEQSLALPVAPRRGRSPRKS